MDFLRKYRHLLAGLLILFVALQIPIYWKQDRSLGLPARILYSIAYYPQSLWASATGGVRSVLSQYVLLVSVAKENERLQKQNAELRGKLHELREVGYENDRLRGLLAMRERSRFDTVGTRIIGLDASAWFQSFTIDVGANDGVKRGMPVVSEEGLVGTVVSVASNSAKVLPIIDMNSAVDVVASRSRARGMLVGRGRERAIVNYLERSEDVREGDILVTSGLGGAFPPGLPVAIIREVRPKTYGLFQDAFVDTIARFGRLENLLVLRYTDGDEIPQYIEAPAKITAPTAITAPTITSVSEPAAEAMPVVPPAAVIPAQVLPAPQPQIEPKPAPAPKPALSAKPPKPAPKPVTAPEVKAINGEPPQDGSPFMGGAALNLPAIPAAMPAAGGPPPAVHNPAEKPVEKPAGKPVEKKSEPVPPVSPPPAPPAVSDEVPLSGGTP